MENRQELNRNLAQMLKGGVIMDKKRYDKNKNKDKKKKNKKNLTLNEMLMFTFLGNQMKK